MYKMFKNLFDRYEGYNVNMNTVVADVVNGMIAH